MKTKKAYEDYLNGFRIPTSDIKSNGGRIPDNAKYGSWLRKNDPVMFEVNYNDFQNIK